jgi:Uma2 family endonuclease
MTIVPARNSNRGSQGPGNLRAVTQVIPASARPFTYHDLAGIPADGYKREIIGGALIVTPAPNLRHQRVIINLGVILRQAETADAIVVPSPFDWFHEDGGVVQPDLLVARPGDFDATGHLRQPAAPLLIVEVLSPSNRSFDLTLKYELYQRLGVPAYWIVDPEAPGIRAFRLREAGTPESRYEVDTEAGPGNELAKDWPFPVRIRPADLVT